MLKPINSTILGAAAEHYVMCQLLRRGMIAALAPAGVPYADIIVSNQEGHRLAAVQVKARREIGSDGGWHMKAKHEAVVSETLFYCFVNFGKAFDAAPECWVLPSASVAEVVRVSYQTWLAMPGKSGQPHKANDMRRLLPSYAHLGLSCYASGWLDPHREAWSLIALASEAPVNNHASISNP